MMDQRRHEALAAARSVLEDDVASDSDPESPEEDEYSDELSSSPSVPDTIDFDCVYSLHVEGQASVSKGDNLTLLDDSNSYWWLVRVLKTQAVGYIPAENIETPFERLARLNKHRNVDLSSATPDDHATGQGSAQARTRIIAPQYPNTARHSPYQGPPGGKTVAFTAPTYFEHSGNEESDDEYDDDDDDEAVSEDEDGEYDPDSVEGEGDVVLAGDESDDDEPTLRSGAAEPAVARPDLAVRPERSAATEVRQASPTTISPPTARPQDPRRPFAPDSGTRKITLTPQIARDGDSVDSHDDMRHRANRLGSQDSAISSEAGSNDHVGGSDDSHRQRSSSKDQPQRKLRKPGPAPINTDEANEGKKKKSGGGVFGFFKKKDKSKGDVASEESATSPPAGRAPSPTTSTESAVSRPDEEDTYLSDATMRQQQVEARQALYTQYGISRAPGDTTNTFVARSSSLEPPRPAAESTPAKAMRPGSLIGSPGGVGDVPMLSVMRVFAGDDVEAEATFKTVLLNSSTSAADLLKQTLQRFRLPIPDADKYYLSIKEMGSGETIELQGEQMPLELLEQLNAADRQGAFPSVKRSSMGSISSVASNLSLHPAIERLGMNDFSDDSAVKIYLHAKASRRANDQNGTGASIPTSPRSPNESFGLSPNVPPRFGIRLLLHRRDLPDGLVFDPATLAIVPKEAQLIGAADDEPAELRDCLLSFPSNVTVADVIENALDRLGIVSGVVHGGDEINKAAKRRSMTRVRYCLTKGPRSDDQLLSPHSLLLDAYSRPPIMRQVERTSRDARRRSLDVSPVPDIREDDPVFFLRNYAMLQLDQSSPKATASPKGLGLQVPPLQPQRTSTSESVYVTPSDELPPSLAPDATRQEITAQRAASRATQRAILSARKNQDQGVDIRMANSATIRSSRNLSNDRVRYSYIDQDGAEFDISEIVETEWSGEQGEENLARGRDEPVEVQRETGNLARDRESVASQEPPILDDARPALLAPTQRRTDNDFLEEALERQRASPYFDETLEERIDRVLAKVKSGSGSTTGFASALRKQRSSDSRQASSATSPASFDPRPSSKVRSVESSRANSLVKDSRPSSRTATRAPLYRLDHTVDDLLTIILNAPAPAPAPIYADPAPPMLAGLFAPGMDEAEMAALRKWYGTSLDTLDTLDSRLDRLMMDVTEQRV